MVYICMKYLSATSTYCESRFHLHRMTINTTAFFLSLTLLGLSTKCCAVEKLYKENWDFVCDYNDITSELVINNGFAEEKVIKCLEIYNTSETLIFRNSRLTTIPGYLNILQRLVNLDLSHNEISTVSFNETEQICKKLKQLILDANYIQILRRGDLSCLVCLEKLYLANNNLSLIENGTFSVTLKALNYVHLVDNNLTSIDSSLFSRILLSSKTYLMVNASRNRITGFTNSIDLTINDVSKSTVMHIVLTHNNFTTIDVDHYFKMFNVTHPFPQLLNLWNSGFDLRFNPFMCDCALFPLASALRKFYTMDQDNPVFSITCGTPISLGGMMIRKVPPIQFNCSITKDCPDSCECIKTIANGLIAVNCGDQYHADDLPMTCPLTGRININMKSDDITIISSREYLRNVTVLDVSQCAVADIDPSIVEKLEGGINRSIYLHDNNFESIPKTFQNFTFGAGQVLTIDGNPFTCDCHTKWMKKWLLSNKEHVRNQDKIICATGPGKGKPIVEVPDNKFVCTKILTFVDLLYIAIGSLFGIVLLFSVTAYKRESIQIWCISNFNICRYFCRQRIRRRLRYDIFIGHSSEDDARIDEIVGFLQKHNPPYNVCIERDLKPGKPISENIASMESSHITLLVISNDFLRNDLCCMEFREAHIMAMARNIDIILIVLEELDASLVITELKSYRETGTYLKYSDSRFRARLLKRLPIMIPSDNVNGEREPLLPPS